MLGCGLFIKAEALPNINIVDLINVLCQVLAQLTRELLCVRLLFIGQILGQRLLVAALKINDFNYFGRFRALKLG